MPTTTSTATSTTTSTRTTTRKTSTQTISTSTTKMRQTSLTEAVSSTTKTTLPDKQADQSGCYCSHYDAQIKEATVFESTRLIGNQECYQLLLCTKGCNELIKTPMKCTPTIGTAATTAKATETTTTVTPTTTTATTTTTTKVPKVCSCVNGENTIPEGHRMVLKIGSSCEQTIACPTGCSHITRSSVRCGRVSAPTTVEPAKAKCTWSGKVFDDSMKIGECLWVQCVETQKNSFAPKLVQSCSNLSSAAEPVRTTTESPTTTKFAMWAPWEVHLYTGLSMGPDGPKFKRQRVEPIVANVDKNNCGIWASCMTQQRCQYMYNRYCSNT